MNKICKYIENIDFQIKQKVRSQTDFDYKTLLSDNFKLNKKYYVVMSQIISDTFKEWQQKSKLSKRKKTEKILMANSEGNDSETARNERKLECDRLKEKLDEIFLTEEELTNHLIYLFYVDKPSYNKSTLWNLCGRQIYQNVRNRVNSCYFPVKDKKGDLEFLYEKYSVRKIELDKIDDVDDEKDSINVNINENTNNSINEN